jgi:hypothetical protein
MCLFCVCVVLYLGRGLATSWSLAQGILPTVKMMMKLKKRPGPTGAVEPVKKVAYTVLIITRFLPPLRKNPIQARTSPIVWVSEKL